MISTRRVKVLTLTVVFAVILVLFYTGDARRHRDADFYQKTVTALDAAKGRNAKDSDIHASVPDARGEAKADSASVPEKVALDPITGDTVQKDPEEGARSRGSKSSSGSDDAYAALGKSPVEVGKERKYKYPEDAEEEKSIAGRKKMKLENGVAGSERVLGTEDKQSKAHADDEGSGKGKDAGAEEELNAILKRSPIIIFSKSYCPYSRRAKTLLLETYSISPAPYVVELDLLTEETTESDANMPKKFSHPDDEVLPLGRRLQNLLAENTGRSTVPNILVNGRSIGGSDDVAEMDRNGVLAETIKSLGGKRITQVEKKKEGLNIPKGS